MINLFAPVDVAVLCEEVVESVFAGYVFQNVTAKTFDMVHDVHDKSSESKRQSATSLAIPHPTDQTPQVSVILDIALDDYNFTTQPGAFRRVIMNLLGNALKYTSHGYVRVKLETAPLEDLSIYDGEKNTEIFAHTDRLFTPFAQENTLSSGTGLGLSIVRSIVNLLEGDITIDSELGRGTEVRVTLPLLREIPKDKATPATPKAVTSLLRETDESISLLRSQINGREIGLFNFSPPNMDPVLAKKGKFLEESVRNFLTNCECSGSLRPCETLQETASQEPPIDTGAVTTFFSLQSLIRGSWSQRKRYRGSETGGMTLTPDVGQGSTNDLSNVFEDLLISPNGGEVLDNSRMAADSENARKAIESPTPNALVEKAKEFPFPSSPSDKASPSHVEISSDDNLTTPTASTFGLTPLPALASENVKSLSSASSTATMSTRRPSIATATPDPFVPNLLLVDDNMINLKLLRHFITRLGYPTVHEAENGLEAVKKVEQRPEGYDIIFMDISMPVLDGFDATREIRKLEKSRREKAIEKW
ncbi:hypothetical protein EYC84_002898 [Monilinia fructicola]|uniref:Response regulatory domain-containing protein n=1 Tax=Monilinia fructicola TaxID=38448 RepID=A0A5M9JWV7_MONFR|nr:hypothetical protein EYC84_002898 [Monilinia fructicola]